MKQCGALDRTTKVRCSTSIKDAEEVCQKHADELEHELWYQTEAKRIISTNDHMLLVEILRVRDSASAFYAICEMLLTDDFPDSETAIFFDKWCERMRVTMAAQQATIQ